jgi:CRP-like cAMP-binding protein
MRTFTDMTFIVSQGQAVGGIYFITAGDVRVMRNIMLSDGRQETIGIDRLEVGDAIGDLAAITRQPIQYSALAQGRVDCLYLEKVLLLEIDKEHWHRLQVAAKPYPPDSQLQALHTQQQRWEQYKSSLVFDIKASKQLRISHTLDGYRSLSKPSK